MTTAYNCRFCGTLLTESFCDLGLSPLANSYVGGEQVGQADRFFPLNVYVCSSCFLVQLPEHEIPDNIFRNYAYFSSFSSSWLTHSRNFAIEYCAKLGLDQSSKVVELASNDGYLLQYFKELGIPVVGVEPARNVAEVARNRGIHTVSEFFGAELAHQLIEDGHQADLVIGNNVLAHVPDINDFVGGIKAILAPLGVVSIEFPHLMELIEHNQFDTIYHEHYSYLSLVSTERIFEAHGLTIFDVEQLKSHGGSIRILASHSDNPTISPSASVLKLREKEHARGLDDISGYLGFMQSVERVKLDFLSFVTDAKRAGKRIVAYGAAAKGNTLLNFCGIGKEFIDFVADLSQHKQGTFLPGTRIPVVAPDKIIEEKPDVVIILPWNLKKEISEQLAEVKGWGGSFVTFIPRLEQF